MHYLDHFGYLLLLGFFFQHVTTQDTMTKNSEGYDCSHIWEIRKNQSYNGIYTIKPLGANISFQVFCEMKHDGGWTLIQSNDGQDGLNFDRTWDEYKLGFGNISGEHWLGLENIHKLTNQDRRTTELLILIEGFDGTKAFTLYNFFTIGTENKNYQLSIGNGTGNAGDAFRNGDSDQNGSFFSTSDRDNDNCSPCKTGDTRYMSCSRNRFHSGWWFNRCGNANLNGKWHPQEKNLNWASSVYWGTFKASESLKYSKMYIRNY
ncbi:hypothetical protein GDO86_005679 [Hymenochirus boettgeri]|nr:hypothetical protein GDO86_005679 [Hymenochirus boettgeri]